MSGATASGDTTRDIPEAQHPLAVWLRRAMLAALALALLAGLLSLLGVRSAESSTTGSGYQLSVVYPRVARPGLDAPWEVTVTHPGGFGGQVTLAVSAHYFDLFESQGFRPQPSDETREGDTYYLSFTAPPEDTFRVYFDAYIQPASQFGRSGWVEVVDGGQVMARTDFSTWLWP